MTPSQARSLAFQDQEIAKAANWMRESDKNEVFKLFAKINDHFDSTEFSDAEKSIIRAMALIGWFDALSVYEMQTSDEYEQFPVADDARMGNLHEIITEDWLRTNGFRIEDGRNDPRLPVRRIEIAHDGIDGRQMFESVDDLCIDVAPVDNSYDSIQKTWTQWYCWIMQVEPYRHIHVRKIKYTWELAKLYEGLTGRVWPGTLR